jgi:hypothetical protein
LADGSPEQILRDIEQGYVEVGVRVQRVCSGNPLEKTRYVWSHSEIKELRFKASVAVFNQQRLAEEAMLGLLT